MPAPVKPAANLLYDEEKFKKQPAGPKVPHGYRRWDVPVMYPFEMLADLVEVDGAKMTAATLADYNFDTKKILPLTREGGIVWYLLTYAGFEQEDSVVWSTGGGAWLWVPGQAVIDGDLGSLGELQKKKPPPLPLPPRPPEDAPIRLAARSQQQGPKAVTTIDQKLQPGDILLSEHQEDDMIQAMTLTWPTHAGICVKPDTDTAVDAMPGRHDHAVNTVLIFKRFFDEDQTPGGGLIYRYTGGADAKKNKEAGTAAARWAEAQVGHEYHFTLKSPILGEERDAKGNVQSYRFEVPEQRFDAKGQAVDAKDQPLMIQTKSKGEIRKLHDIYCAELVWRAYRFGAGVALVDPKRFFCMYDHPNRVVTGLVVFQIEAEADTDFSGRITPGSSPTLEGIKKGFSSFWSHLATNALARKVVIKKMRAKHSGYLCAPHQFLESSLLTKVRLVKPSKHLDKHEVYNFHSANIHPLDVVENLEKGELPFKAWCKAHSQVCETSVDDPLHLQPKV
jgi:hypothetical protein